MENQRPKLTNPTDYARVKDNYFEKDFVKDENVDTIERLDRIESRQRNINNNSR